MPLSKSLSNFVLDLGKTPDRFLNQFEKNVKRATLQLYGNLIRATPVDTGLARSNWNLRFGSADNTVTEDKNAVKGQYTPESNRKIQEAQTTLQSNDLRFQSKIVISNHTKYILPLSNGWSPQAPAGWVDVEIANMKHAIQEF